MILFKLIYHIRAFIIKFILKSFYSFGNSKLVIGKHVTFRKGFSVMIDKGGIINIGNNVFFNNYCTLDAVQQIIIGDGTIFGEGVKIYDHNHRYRDTTVPIKEQGYTSSPVKIGNHCWIASNVVILKGVNIGNNCVIGAGCVIYKDIPDNTVVYSEQNLIIKDID